MNENLGIAAELAAKREALRASMEKRGASAAALPVIASVPFAVEFESTDHGPPALPVTVADPRLVKP